MRNGLFFILIVLVSLSDAMGQERQKAFLACYDSVNRLLFDDTIDAKAFGDTTVAVCLEALGFDSKIANLYEGVGVGYLKAEKPWAAAMYLDEALTLAPKSSRAHGFRGEANRMRGRTDDSIKDLNEALKLDPNNVYALFQRALTHKENRQKEKAIADLQELLRIVPGDKKAETLLKELGGVLAGKQTS